MMNLMIGQKTKKMFRTNQEDMIEKSIFLGKA